MQPNFLSDMKKIDKYMRNILEICDKKFNSVL